ncbi:hypothetical protein [Shewanella algae]|uniref:hypothetical protein n=1 Tax=Shewanella algae TaxID=38313 RepID=UPI0031F51AF1
MFFFKKKYLINHPVFGVLKWTDSEFVGELYFEPVGTVVEVFFSCKKKEFCDDYERVWGVIKEMYFDIREKSAEAINRSDFDLYKYEISQESLKDSNLVVESLCFDMDLSVKFFWGVITHEQSETPVQVVTSFSLSDGSVQFLGGGD